MTSLKVQGFLIIFLIALLPNNFILGKDHNKISYKKSCLSNRYLEINAENKTPHFESTNSFKNTIVSQHKDLSPSKASSSLSSSIVVVITQTEFACNGLSENVATPIVTGGTEPYSFLWSDNTTDSIATALPAGMQSLTVLDSDGNSVTENIMITDLDQIEFSIIPSNPICTGTSTGSLEITNISGGNNSSGYSYIFNSSNPVSDNIIIDLPANLLTTLQVIDGQGCTSEIIEVELIDPPALEANLNAQGVSCGGLSDGSINVVSVSFGQAPFNYNWSMPGNGNFIENLEPGSYEVTITDNLGCITTQAFEIDEPEPVIADFDLTQPLCNGKNTGQIDLTTTGGAGNYTYLWSSGEDTQDLENIFSGTYQVTVTDGNDCTFDFEIDLPQPTPINPGLTFENLSCFQSNDGMISLNATGATPPYTFLINEIEYVGNPILNGLAPGNYAIRVLDDRNCKTDTSITILEPEELIISFPSGSNLSLNLEDELYLDENYIEILNNQGDYEVTWIPSFEGTLSCTDCENPVATPFNTISYNIIVIDENNCVDQENLVINVNKYRVVSVPRGFSPNGDNINDMLLIHGKNGTIVNTFQVFDRYGTMLFEKYDFEINDQIGWDGLFKGKEMPAGAYLWNANVTYIDGLSEKHEGITNLIR